MLDMLAFRHGLEVAYTSLIPSKERRYSDIIPSITQKAPSKRHLQRPQYMSRVSSKLRDIFLYNEYDTIKETQEPDKVGFAEVVKSEKWEVSRSKCDPSNCRI
jgi:hypothetical protein